MEVLRFTFFALVALFILVSFHEFGHYWVARRCGVKVLRFSIGFGPVIFRKSTSQTEFALSAIPLGGYVKMFGEGAQQDTDEELSDEEKSVSYSHKSVWQRMAIVVAGPVANFILAIFFYTLMFSGGVKGVAPIVGAVENDSLAQHAGIIEGAEILAIDGHKTTTWADVFDALILRVGDTGALSIEWASRGDGNSHTSELPIQRWHSDMEEADLLASLGIDVFRPKIEATIAEVVPGSPAEKAGLLVGDRFVRVKGDQVTDWQDLVDTLRAAPGETLRLTIDRGGDSQSMNLTPESVTEGGKAYGRIGVRPVIPEWDPDMVRNTQYNPLQAVSASLNKTWEMSVFILSSIKKLITGDVSTKSIGGPISIAKFAGNSADAGWQPFFSFIAIMSVTLAVMNLLPIPVLDGGHLLFYVIEAVKGSPVNDTVQGVAMRFGMMAVFSLMAFAIFNDFMRL